MRRECEVNDLYARLSLEESLRTQVKFKEVKQEGCIGSLFKGEGTNHNSIK